MAQLNLIPFFGTKKKKKKKKKITSAIWGKIFTDISVQMVSAPYSFLIFT